MSLAMEWMTIATCLVRAMGLGWDTKTDTQWRAPRVSRTGLVPWPHGGTVERPLGRHSSDHYCTYTLVAAAVQALNNDISFGKMHNWFLSHTTLISMILEFWALVSPHPNVSKHNLPPTPSPSHCLADVILKFSKSSHTERTIAVSRTCANRAACTYCDLAKRLFSL